MLRIRKHRPSLSEIAYDEIKSMILLGELPQGERIILNRISQTLNLSMTPIREALNRLVQEDLVSLNPRSSYEVISLSREDISDILDLREMLETFALMTAGEELFHFPVRMFRNLFGKLRSSRNYKKFIESDVNFHEAIIGRSNNKKLVKLFSYIRNPERLIMVPSAKIEGRMEAAIREHLKIIDAIEKRDLDLATKHLRSHIQRVKFLLLEGHAVNAGNRKGSKHSREVTRVGISA